MILVTTKQGKEGKVSINYDGNIGWSNIYRLPQLLTAGQYMQVMDMVRFNAGEGTRDWSQYFKGQEALLAAYKDGSNAGTDWVEALRNKNAVTTSHSLLTSLSSLLVLATSIKMVPLVVSMPNQTIVVSHFV